MYKIFFLLILSISLFGQSSYFHLKGTVTDKSTNKLLPGCNIFINSIDKGTITDKNGDYDFYLKPGSYSVRFSYVGYKTETLEITIENKVHHLNVALSPSVIENDQVTVTAKREYSTTTVQSLDQAEIKKMPKLYDDVLRTVKILPGVTSNNELSSSYNVRGGNFNENLIYLNGYEIYRPFLLQRGVEENQSLVNPDLTQSIQFYNGTFPATLGDKMSSALEISYNQTNQKSFRGTFRADLLNSGISASGKQGNLSWAAGVRYSYPFLLQDQLQTSGIYRPEFRDVQVLLNYNLSSYSSFEFFGITAFNKYKLLPEEWVGHFKSDRGGEINALTFKFDGENNYTFNTHLLGLKYKYDPDSTFNITFKTSYYSTREDEFKNQSSDIFYSPDAEQPNFDQEYIKTRFEYSDNYIKMNRLETGMTIQKIYKNHILKAGAQLSLISYSDKIDEVTREEGDQIMFDEPYSKNSLKKHDLNYISAYVEDNIDVLENLHVNAGMRISRYDYNDESLLSPRANIVYKPFDVHTFSFSWGYYYQSPFFYELRNKVPGEEKLHSQRAIHYVLGWEWQFKEKVKFQAELYYKDLYNLIPFYVEQMKLEYLTNNNSEGYAFGLDALVQGELDPGMQSWIGYSYLDTRERLIGTKDYKRRILDQTHTIQIYIQDRIDKHPNWQSHLRLLFGSGFLFHHRKTEYSENNIPYITIDYDTREEYLFYARADMGLSATFELGNNSSVMVMAEVMNVFNNYNFAGYEWVQVFRDYPHPIRIPQIYSKRFYNLKVEVSF